MGGGSTSNAATININFGNVNVRNEAEGRDLSRMIAQTLRGEMRSMGFAT
jgi:hypothetical protein